jgi:small subunit ribosomal protein S4
MARYTGPKLELLVNLAAIFGDDKAFERLPPGQHGMAKKRGKKSELSVNGEAS